MAATEPTPEDYEAARKEMERDPGERAREIFFNLEVKRQARLRVERERLEAEHERRERHRKLLRRLLRFRRGS